MAKAPYIEFKGLLSFLILHELSSKSLYGEQLAEKIGARKGEKLTPGTIYPALKHLKAGNLIKFSQDGRKKIYSLTPQGKKELANLYKIFGKYFAGLSGKISKPKKAKKAAKKPAKKTEKVDS